MEFRSRLGKEFSFFIVVEFDKIDCSIRNFEATHSIYLIDSFLFVKGRSRRRRHLQPHAL